MGLGKGELRQVSIQKLDSPYSEKNSEKKKDESEMSINV